MKKIIILLIVAGIIFALFYFKSNSVEVQTNTETKTGESFRPDPSNASFKFDDEVIQLSKGRSTTSSGEETAILDKETFGDVNADGKDDAVILISQTGGGSGNFIYVAAYVSGPVSYKGTNAVFLGDRIAPGNVSIKNGVINVTYLDRGADEPFAAEPTISVTKELVYQSGELVEK